MVMVDFMFSENVSSSLEIILNLEMDVIGEKL